LGKKEEFLLHGGERNSGRESAPGPEKDYWWKRGGKCGMGGLKKKAITNSEEGMHKKTADRRNVHNTGHRKRYCKRCARNVPVGGKVEIAPKKKQRALRRLPHNGGPSKRGKTGLNQGVKGRGESAGVGNSARPGS